jgi:hypothetical protein
MLAIFVTADDGWTAAAINSSGRGGLCWAALGAIVAAIRQAASETW